MGAHMKTTIDIADALLEAAKKRAHDEKRTLRDLVEEGLRHVLTEKPRKPFKMRKIEPLHGELVPGIRYGDWETIRDIIYGLK